MTVAEVHPGWLELVLATALIAINGGISVALELRLGGKIALAATRTVVQLLLVGLVLEQVFAIASPWVVVALALVMMVIAGNAAVGRVRYRYRGIHIAATLSVVGSASILALLSLLVVLRPDPWFAPRYAIPILGMILGNTLTGISLGVDSLTRAIRSERDSIEMALALGATRREAAVPLVRDAVRTGMTPILNSMMIVGLVSLPGMMTGQLLAGAPPGEAVRFQIIIMFVIASGTALGTMAAVEMSKRRLFSPDHQLLIDRLHDSE